MSIPLYYLKIYFNIRWIHEILSFFLFTRTLSSLRQFLLGHGIASLPGSRRREIGGKIAAILRKRSSLPGTFGLLSFLQSGGVTFFLFNICFDLSLFGLELNTVAILLTGGGAVVVLVGCMLLVSFANVFVVCTLLLLVCSFSVGVLFTCLFFAGVLCALATSWTQVLFGFSMSSVALRFASE